jgi:hypothetical protein
VDNKASFPGFDIMVSENRTEQAEQGDAPGILQTDKDNTCVASWLKLPCVRKI